MRTRHLHRLICSRRPSRVGRLPDRAPADRACTAQPLTCVIFAGARPP